MRYWIRHADVDIRMGCGDETWQIDGQDEEKIVHSIGIIKKEPQYKILDQPRWIFVRFKFFGYSIFLLFNTF